MLTISVFCAEALFSNVPSVSSKSVHNSESYGHTMYIDLKGTA